MDEQGVGVVLDAQALPGVDLFVQSPHGLPWCRVVGDERRPAPGAGAGPSQLAAG